MPDATPSWRQRAQAAYDETQAEIPADWRLDERLVAPAWVDVAAQDPDEVEQRVDGVLASSGILSEDELRIVHSDATAIVDKLQRGEWSAVAVVTGVSLANPLSRSFTTLTLARSRSHEAFCKSAAVAQQLYRCCTELFFDRALARARELDDHFSRTGKPVGPLHGLPISLKDQYELKGIRTSIGLSSLLDFVGKTDAAVVQSLESQGAVIFVKSNIPMSLMSADSVNNVWGRCLNPRDRTRTAGGSSGGEAALSAAFGSPAGIGSDIAGSCRIPSAMCGTYGMKPSYGRIPLLGGKGCGAGAEFVLPVLGPMGRSVATLELLMRSIAATEPWRLDPTCVPMPWTPVSFDRPLRIGIIRDNGMVRPHPPISRTLEETAVKLEAAGHTVVEWDVSDMHVRAHSLAFAFFRQDGGATLRAALQDEPILPNVDTGCPGSELSAQEIIGKHWEAFGLRVEYRQRWEALQLDAVICPTVSHAATRHNEYNDVSNTLPWNLLQYCSVAMPVGKVEERDMDISEDWVQYKPRGIVEDKPGFKKARGDEENHAMWLDEKERRGMLGLPLSLQVVTPNHTDERCLAIAAIIDEIVKQ
ncbi:general amidase GmdB [Rhodotorula toruloides]|uniref:General amidase GmdB n=1 Tax=Rhodotorula toruloides TaxID=5286 RepID=A0A2S9ZWK2_RHOTO|nr:general amidase GmdB [Rhodotorula toruloides]